MPIQAIHGQDSSRKRSRPVAKASIFSSYSGGHFTPIFSAASARILSMRLHVMFTTAA
jgi:hypothetical protein